MERRGAKGEDPQHRSSQCILRCSSSSKDFKYFLHSFCYYVMYSKVFSKVKRQEVTKLSHDVAGYNLDQVQAQSLTPHL